MTTPCRDSELPDATPTRVGAAAFVLNDARDAEIAEVADQLEILLARIDLLGFRMAGNHISHGLELLRTSPRR